VRLRHYLTSSGARAASVAERAHGSAISAWLFCTDIPPQATLLQKHSYLLAPLNLIWKTYRVYPAGRRAIRSRKMACCMFATAAASSTFGAVTVRHVRLALLLLVRVPVAYDGVLWRSNASGAFSTAVVRCGTGRGNSA